MMTYKSKNPCKWHSHTIRKGFFIQNNQANFVLCINLLCEISIHSLICFAKFFRLNLSKTPILAAFFQLYSFFWSLHTFLFRHYDYSIFLSRAFLLYNAYQPSYSIFSLLLFCRKSPTLKASFILMSSKTCV